MDLGIYKRSRLLFWAWILTPLAAIAGLYLSVRLFSNTIHRTLDRHHAFVKLLPDLDSQITRAKTLLEQFEVTLDDNTATLDALHSALQEVAARTGFVIDAVSVKPAGAEEHIGAITASTISIKGQGSLYATMSFCHRIQSDHRLLVMDTAELKLLQSVPLPTYRAEFKVIHHEVNRAVGALSRQAAGRSKKG
jgi:hypothetical protein